MTMKVFRLLTLTSKKSLLKSPRMTWQTILYSRCKHCNTHVLIVSLIVDSKFVINVNRVRDLIFVLAVFDSVFVLDLSSKSTSAQNESCRSFNPLQLLFWPNFKLLYEIWSFSRSNWSQNRSASKQ